MGGRLVQGQWTTKPDWEKTTDGSFKRQESFFRHFVGTEPRFAVAEGRYHLFISHACPWAHRTMIVRALLGLEDAISVSAVHPLMTDEGWHFDPEDPEYPTVDALFGERYLRDVYLRADPEFTGRVTVPVLWDRVEQTIVNNESREIIEMFSTVFEPLWTRPCALYPEDLRTEINAAMDAIYGPINNGVYRCGFAGTQAAYDAALAGLFGALEHWEDVLGRQRFMVGESMTLADVALFTTLVRFDLVYYVHFKTNLRHIYEMPNLWGFVRDVYQMTNVAETCRLDEYKVHYYRSHPQLNPRGFVPGGPQLNLDAPVHR
jgi:putative glutathione S-transferase